MNRLRRWFFRAPIALYRLGLGGLLGRRFLLLEHRGRRSGLRRRTVLEVVDREGATPVVVSGYGRRSDWLANVRADPAVTVTWGHRRFAARARIVGHSEAVAAFDRYRKAHPRAARFLGRALGISVLDDSDTAAREMPVVRLEPTETTRI